MKMNVFKSPFINIYIWSKIKSKDKNKRPKKTYYICNSIYLFNKILLAKLKPKTQLLK